MKLVVLSPIHMDGRLLPVGAVVYMESAKEAAKLIESQSAAPAEDLRLIPVRLSVVSTGPDVQQGAIDV